MDVNVSEELPVIVSVPCLKSYRDGCKSLTIDKNLNLFEGFKIIQRWM